jgi:hypothetical protein
VGIYLKSDKKNVEKKRYETHCRNVIKSCCPDRIWHFNLPRMPRLFTFGECIENKGKKYSKHLADDLWAVFFESVFHNYEQAMQHMQ